VLVAAVAVVWPAALSWCWAGVPGSWGGPHRFRHSASYSAGGGSHAVLSLEGRGLWPVSVASPRHRRVSLCRYGGACRRSTTSTRSRRHA